MLKLIIEDDEGRKTVVPFVREEITIGRQEGNTIRLTERNVSRKHARLLRLNGSVVVEDLGSYTGVRVNGERVTGQSTVRDGDLIQIGDYDLTIQQDSAVTAAPAAPGKNGATPPRPSPRPPPEDDDGEADTEASTPIYKPLGGDEQRKHATSIIRVDALEGKGGGASVEDVDVQVAPRLVLMNTDDAGQEFACIRTELKIGRVADNDIAIDHRSLSRTHAKLVRNGDGEWQVVDLQSANGITVNGEPYAQAGLKSGDVLELGHVQLKFLAAGEKYVQGGGRRGKKKSRTGLLLLAGVAVLAGGAAAVFVLGPALGLNPKKPPEVVVKPPEPPEKTDPPKVADPVTPEKPSSDAPDAALAAKTPETDAAEKARVAALVTSAKALFSAKKLDEAAAALEPLKGPDGMRPPDAEDLSDQINAERLVANHLAAAEAALTAKDLETAKTHLDDSEGTALFAAELSTARKKLDAAVAEAAKTKTVSVKPKPKDVPKVDKVAEAKKSFEEGMTLFKGKQLAPAKNQFKKCIELDPNHATCHMMLGSIYAKQQEVDRGAQHYRMFVKLAPNDPKAAQVRALLEQYDNSKKATP